MSDVVKITDSKLSKLPMRLGRHLKGFQIHQFPVALGWLGALALCAGTALSPLNLSAGEKLVILGHKARIEPGQEMKSNTGFNRMLDGTYIQAPYDGTSKPRPRIQTQPRNTRLDQRMRNERDEKENWALLAPGELEERQAKDQSQPLPVSRFSVRNQGNAEAADNPETPRDYTFYTVEKKLDQAEEEVIRGGSRSGAGSRSQNSRSNEERRSRSDEDRPMNLNAFKSEAAASESAALGGHVASELNFRSLVNPDVTTAGIGSGPDGTEGLVTLQNLLGSSASARGAANSSAQDQRLDHFRSLLTPNASAFESSSRGSAYGDPVNGTPDLTQRPVNPVEGFSSGQAPANLLRDALQPPATFSAPSRGVFSPRSQGGFGEPSISGFSSLPSPNTSRRESLLNDFRTPSERSSPVRRP